MNKLECLEYGRKLLATRYGVDISKVTADVNYLYVLQAELSSDTIKDVAVQYLYKIEIKDGLIERKTVKGFWTRDLSKPDDTSLGSYSIDYAVLKEKTSDEMTWEDYIDCATSYLSERNIMTYPSTWQKLSGDAAVVNAVRYSVDTPLGKRALNEQIMIYRNNGVFGHFVIQNIVQNATYEAK